MLADQGGGTDDDSLDYDLRNGGHGTTPDDHNESQYDLDLFTMEKTIRKRRCKLHPEEHSRYVCFDHELVLCPRCLIGHKSCDFQPMGKSLTHEAKKRFRALSTVVTLRHNITLATDRKLNKTVEGLEMYKEVQMEEIDYSFDEIIDTLNARREIMK
jgi:hypothetical protein